MRKKKRKCSSEIVNKSKPSKQPNHNGGSSSPADSQSVEVSNVLHGANDLLYGHTDFSPSKQSDRLTINMAHASVVNPANSMYYAPSYSPPPNHQEVFHSGTTYVQPPQNTHAHRGQAPPQQQPTEGNREVNMIAFIQSFEARMETRFHELHNRLNKLNIVEEKMSDLEKSVDKLWVTMDAKLNKMEERMLILEGRVDGVDFVSCDAEDKLKRLQAENDNLKESVVDLMKNNLVFEGIAEKVNETTVDVEEALKQLFVSKLEIPQVQVDEIRFEIAHRFGRQDNQKPRRIVARFSKFKDRELIRTNSNKLRQTNIFIYEQYPPEVIEERRRLVPEFKRCKREGIPCRLTHNKLFVNGRRWLPTT